jgi:hypothetical protein
MGLALVEEVSGKPAAKIAEAAKDRVTLAWDVIVRLPEKFTGKRATVKETEEKKCQKESKAQSSGLTAPRVMVSSRRKAARMYSFTSPQFRAMVTKPWKRVRKWNLILKKARKAFRPLRSTSFSIIPIIAIKPADYFSGFFIACSTHSMLE